MADKEKRVNRKWKLKENHKHYPYKKGGSRRTQELEQQQKEQVVTTTQ